MILGVLGGSGLYDLEGIEDVREELVQTPFGEPSGPIVTGRVGEARLAFLPRHGRGHRLLPSEINYRANVHAMKQLGVERVLSVSAVGALRDGIAPGDLVLVDQFIDRSYRRVATFFGDGVVGHVSFAQPVCAELAALVAEAAVAAGGARLHRGGTYLCMEGPQFSTRAESLLHRSWGAAVVGMTAATEAKLCREAELCFTQLALVTDYDCWHDQEAAVTAEAVLEVLLANVARAKEIVRRVLALAATGAGARGCACGRAAEHAILTSRDAIPAAARERLRTLYGRYM